MQQVVFAVLIVLSAAAAQHGRNKDAEMMEAIKCSVCDSAVAHITRMFLRYRRECQKETLGADPNIERKSFCGDGDVAIEAAESLINSACGDAVTTVFPAVEESGRFVDPNAPKKKKRTEEEEEEEDPMEPIEPLGDKFRVAVKRVCRQSLFQSGTKPQIMKALFDIATLPESPETSKTQSRKHANEKAIAMQERVCAVACGDIARSLEVMQKKRAWNLKGEPISDREYFADL